MLPTWLQLLNLRKILTFAFIYFENKKEKKTTHLIVWLIISTF